MVAGPAWFVAKARQARPDNESMNIQALRSLVAEVSARLNPLSPSSLFDHKEPSGSTAGLFQRDLLAVAAQLVRGGNGRIDHPTGLAQAVELPEGINNAEAILANVSLSNDWANLAAKVIQLHEVLAAR